MGTAKKPTGWIVYNGPSLLDGSPIVAIALTGKSSNRKTGAMVQTYILRTDIDPIAAVKSGADSAICGACPHRGVWDSLTLRMVGRSCYVNLGQGTRSVFAAFLRGNYPAAPAATVADYCRGRMVRLGTYGDPAAVPAQVWTDLIAHAAGHTGYTHQSRNQALDPAHRAAIARLCMVSADTLGGALSARLNGFRYFRVRRADEPIAAGEFICPASEEAGKRTTCAKCGACNGTRDAVAGDKRGSPVIIAHGPLKTRFPAVQTRA